MIEMTEYTYHTFALELLPHEARFLIDGNVIRRMPDRLIPIGNRHYDWITTMQRAPDNIHISGMDIDADWVTPVETNYFKTHTSCPGCGDVEIPPGSGHWYHAAHLRVDYVKVFDVPSDVTIPGFPQ
jgi:hypothetical protein